MRAMAVSVVAGVLMKAVSSGTAMADGVKAAVVRPADPLHAWVGLKDASGLETWVQWHINEEKRLISELTAVTADRSVDYTLAKYDEAVAHLQVAGNQAYILFSVYPEKSIRDKGQALVQAISAEQTELTLNQAVYAALKGVDTHAADAATRHYLERLLLGYRLAGVDKDEATRAKVRTLQDEMTSISLRFSRNVQDDVRTIPVKDVSALEGLPADYIARHKPGADGSITLTTDSPDYMPVMSYAKSAALRRTMYLAYNDRAYPVNKGVLEDLLRVRQQMATTLGFDTWADLATADMMMGSAGKMKAFLNEVDEASRGRAEKEFARIQHFVNEKDPKAAADLTQSDSGYWGEQFRRATYDFDSQSVRPYFAYAAVEAGILQTAARLFHVEFRKALDAAVWDPTVHAFDVYDTGQKQGRIYLDMHPRDGKNKWFSESQLVPGKAGVQLPEAALICNFSGGVPGDPGLMEFGEVVTFFHEFGHMMHEVLGGRQRWAGQSGVSTEGDFVEAPSQMLEEMFHDPHILQSFAKQYQTGEVLPLGMIERMNQADYFGRGNWVQRQLLYATYSLQVHNEAPGKVDLDALWRQDAAKYNPYKFVEGSYFYASFTHLTGYSSNYYTYVLDKVIAVDFFSQFDEKNLLDGPAALRYRKAVLEPGSSKPATELVKDFLGRPQSLDALKTWMDKQYEGKVGMAMEAQ